MENESSKKTKISKVVANEYDRTKGSEARKLVYSLKQSFVGFSHDKIQ